ncbi:MAG: L-histidine N(alpha)-methyltransferase [Bacteroidota bacterium]
MIYTTNRSEKTVAILEGTELNGASQKINRQFAADVYAGLTADEKYLSSKYLYNKRGDEIFQQIMQMEEYYPTRAEYEIFEMHCQPMLEYFAKEQLPFRLIEFGAGDGTKTKVLLRHFLGQKANFSYVPIDISANIIKELTADLAENMPDLTVQGIQDDYFRAIDQLKSSFNGTQVRNVVLFLGANIGNFSHPESIAFLKEIAAHLSPGDLLMTGFDLKKEPERILNAYFDKKGITRNFKHNLLLRINEELGANFEIDNFQYFPIYDPMEGSIRSYLVSKKDQQVTIPAIEEVIQFEAWEAIYMERSQKYSLGDIEGLAKKSGFSVVHHFYDSQKLFTDSLWQLL